MGKVLAGAFFVEANGFTVVQHDPEEWARYTESAHGHNISKTPNSAVSETLHSHAFKVTFDGGNPSPQIIADKPLYTYNNYFVGDDQRKWATGCKTYQGITIKDV